MSEPNIIAPRPDYYSIEGFCSNSALTKLKMELSGQVMPDLKETYRFGSLFDAVVTEPSALALIQHTPSELKVCQDMFASFMRNPVCAMIHKNFETQFELFMDALPFEYASPECPNNTLKFTLPFKMRADFYRSRKGTTGKTKLADLKSTSCTSQKQFEAACEQFDYDRQAACYMKCTDADEFILIGVSKLRPYNVFIVNIKHGDERHKSGLEKLNYLAFKKWVIG